MSVDLNAELNDFRAMIVTLKDDIIRQRDAVSASSINTVMGSCVTAGIMERDNALAALASDDVLTSMLDSCDDTAAAKVKVAQIMIACSKHASELVSNEAAKLIADKFLQDISDCADKATTTANEIRDKAATIILEAEARANVITAARAKAKRTYDEQWKFINEQSEVLKAYDTRLKQMGTEIEGLCKDVVNIDGDALGLKVNAMSSTQKVVNTQRLAALKEMATHFGARTSELKTKDAITLHIPNNMEAGKGKQFNESFRAFRKAHADRFGFTMAELNRIDSDYDPKTQSFYKPPSIPEDINKIDSISREGYTADAATLYDEIYNKLSQAIKNRVKGTILYGFGANKLETEVNHGDGPTLYFALMCMFRPCVGVEQTLKDLFYAAHEAFVKEANPMKVVSELRSSLLEAAELHTEFEWSQSGAKIVEALGHKDHNMSKALEAFEDITPANSQVTSTLQKLFAAIDRQCRKEEKYEDEVAGTGNKRKHANLASGAFERLGLGGAKSANNQRQKAECRHGDKCTFGDRCHFYHPNRKAKTHVRSSEKGGDYVDKNKNVTGGKCEGYGCPEVNQKKRLCTTCFSKSCEHGSIKVKGGGPDYKPPPKAASRRVFSAATKALKKAVVKATDNDDDATIPGSGGPKNKKLKRLANSAKADEDADLSHRMLKMEAFAKTLEGMGMKFE